MELLFDSFILNLCIIPASITLILIVQYFISFSYWKFKKVPFIPPKFPFGNANLLPKEEFCSPEWFSEIYKAARVLKAKYIGLTFFTKPVLVIVDPNIIEDILTKDSQYFEEPEPKLNVDFGKQKWRANQQKDMFEMVLREYKDLESFTKSYVWQNEAFDAMEIFEKLRRCEDAENYSLVISSAIKECFYELSRNELIQNKLRHEIVSILCKNNDDITHEGIEEMTYLHQVVLETLRKYPPVPLLKTVLKQNYKFSSTNVTIQKGMEFWIPILGLHNDMWSYPRPALFNPDNFTEMERIKRHPYMFLPFGREAFNCQEFQLMLLRIKVPLIILLRLFTYSGVSRSGLLTQFYAGKLSFLEETRIHPQTKLI